MNLIRTIHLSSAAALVARARGAEPAPEMVFDGSAPGEPIRALHGVDGGPLAAGGLLDLSPRWKEAAFPLARLQVQWTPKTGPRVELPCGELRPWSSKGDANE